MMTKKHKENMKKEQAQQIVINKQSLRRNITLGVLAVLVASAVFFMRGHVQGTLQENTMVTQPNAQLMQSTDSQTAAASTDTTPAEPTDPYASLPWNLILVNRDHLLPQDFTVDLEKVDDKWVDTRMADSLRQMLQAAKDSGVDLIVQSAYRSVSKQSSLYQEEIASNEAQGYDSGTSAELTNQYIQSPGASEHHTGLAVDIVTSSYQSLDSGFANTVAFGWLHVNAVKYGFVIRYPESKQESTGILYEPWHFRYVGTQAAKEMTEQGLCLEEYVQNLIQTDANGTTDGEDTQAADNAAG